VGDRRFWVTTNFVNNEVWDPPRFRLWGLFSWLMATAKDEQRPADNPRRILWEGRSRTLDAGQFTTNYRLISDALRWPVGTVHHYMQALQTLGVVALESAKGRTLFSIVTICNWSDYQPEWSTTRTLTERYLNANRTLTERPKRKRERERGKEDPEGSAESDVVERLKSKNGADAWPTTRLPWHPLTVALAKIGNAITNSHFPVSERDDRAVRTLQAQEHRDTIHQVWRSYCTAYGSKADLYYFCQRFRELAVRASEDTL
jgi:hypothetical protein